MEENTQSEQYDSTIDSTDTTVQKMSGEEFRQYTDKMIYEVKYDGRSKITEKIQEVKDHFIMESEILKKNQQVILFSLCGASDQTQCFMHARQVLFN